MRTEKKEQRRAEIEAQAFALLKEAGFEGTSMAMIAKRSKASMETVYSWYGDKRGLFAALVERNAQQVILALQEADAKEQSPKERLRITARALLLMLSGEHAIALNRAAVNDTTGVLGKLLAEHGRKAVGPHFAGLLIAWRQSEDVRFEDVSEATATFFDLMIGDHQIRRAIGAIGPMSVQDSATRTDRAIQRFEKIYCVDVKC